MEKKQIALRYIKNMSVIILGTFIMGFAFNVFQAPNHITPTGFSGIATIISYLLGNAGVHISPSPIYLALNAFLFIFAYRMIGKEFCVYSLTGILGYALAMEVLSYVHINVGNDLLLCCIYGGCLMGVGTGLVIRAGGSTGGADMSAVILRKVFPNLTTGALIVIIDGAIIGCSALLFGLNLGMYSLISCLLMGSICDTVANGQKAVNVYYIVTNKAEEISKEILARVNRGVSSIEVTGMYSHQQHSMLMVVVRRYEVPTLKRIVHELDEQAFIVSVNAREAIGVGFDKYMEYNKPKLEFKLAKRIKSKKTNTTNIK